LRSEQKKKIFFFKISKNVQGKGGNAIKVKE
jgi:hypothetical protein